MLSQLTTFLVLTGAAAAASSTSAAASSTTSFSSAVLSFPFVDTFRDATYVPDSGVSGRIVGVESSRTTMIYTCPGEGAKSDDDYYNNKVGALCPSATHKTKEMIVTYGDGFFGEPVIYSLDKDGKTTAEFDFSCEITATPAKNDASITAKKDPVCTYDLKDVEHPKEFKAELECWQEGVAGPMSAAAKETYNTESVNSCFSSITGAKGTPKQALVTHPASVVRYWTVTVTDIPTNVTIAASQTAKNDAPAGKSFGVTSWAAGVLGLMGVVWGL